MYCLRSLAGTLCIGYRQSYFIGTRVRISSCCIACCSCFHIGTRHRPFITATINRCTFINETDVLSDRYRRCALLEISYRFGLLLNGDFLIGLNSLTLCISNRKRNSLFAGLIKDYRRIFCFNNFFSCPGNIPFQATALPEHWFVSCTALPT